MNLDRKPLERLDVFPYRHRVQDVMRSPLITLPGDRSLEEGTKLMSEAAISSLVIDPEGLFGGPGIVTERDVLSAVATGGAALERPLKEFMSTPIEGVPAESYLYVAIGRMERLGVRHLLAFDVGGKPIGMVTARALLKQRASRALVLGDQVAEARSSGQLCNVRDSLPALANGLLNEGVPATEIANVISAVLREISARAATLAAEKLGKAPARWAYLVLGSAGRGESLLSADQDNAIVHDGEEEAVDSWFAELGRRASEILHQAGIPLCKGGIMASRPAWRHSLAGWRKVLEDWAAKAEGESLLAVDIFYDFRRACGAPNLAEALRAQSMQAGQRPILSRMMAKELEGVSPPLGLLGGFRLTEGRLDLKLHGLFPIVAGARAMALAGAIPATSTADRLTAVAAGGRLSQEDLEGLSAARELFMSLILRQQIADVAAGGTAGTTVDPSRLSPGERRRLKDALRRAAEMATTAADAVVHR